MLIPPFVLIAGGRLPLRRAGSAELCANKAHFFLSLQLLCDCRRLLCTREVRRALLKKSRERFFGIGGVHSFRGFLRLLHLASIAAVVRLDADLFRRKSHRLRHLICRLNVIKLRLEE